MTQDEHHEDYLDLFKPKSDAVSSTESNGVFESAGVEADAEARPNPPLEEPTAYEVPASSNPGGSGCNCRMWAIALAALGVLLVLSVFVIWVGWRVLIDDDGDEPKPTATEAITSATPTVSVTDSPLLKPLVSSDDVRVPVALPVGLQIGEHEFEVQAVDTPSGSWPSAPAAGDTAAWAYGTLVNYVMGLAPTAENAGLLSELGEGDPILLTMSTGNLLRFSVAEITSGEGDEADLGQGRPRISLALLASDSKERTVVVANFMVNEINPDSPLTGAVSGVVGAPLERDGVRVTLLDSQQVSAQEAGLPAGTLYVLVDFSVENIGAGILQTDLFQLELQTADGTRYPLSFPALQFANYGLPVDPLAPGETVVGSAGYLVPANLSGPVNWIFNPLPGSDHWILVMLSLDEVPPTPTPEPAPPVGFARVTISEQDIFIDQRNGLLVLGGEIENISEGQVVVTEADIKLSSTAGEGTLVATAPLLPWEVDPGKSALFELQFALPPADSAMIEVLGYTFSIEGLGGG